MYECDPAVVYDENNLPDDVCDEIQAEIRPCMANIATGWAVSGDDVSLQSLISSAYATLFQKIVEFPEIGGYPVGGDTDVKYYMVQMHYDNPSRTPSISYYSL